MNNRTEARERLSTFKIIHHALDGLLGVESSGRGCRVVTWEFEQDSGIRQEIILTQRTEKHIVGIRATETVKQWREDGTEGRNGRTVNGKMGLGGWNGHLSKERRDGGNERSVEGRGDHRDEGSNASDDLSGEPVER